MNVPRIVRQARRRKGWTQRQLAERADVPQSTVARIESGAVMPRVDTLQKLLRACDESLEALPRPGIGVDVTLIDEMLKLTPEERLHAAESYAASLARLKASA